MQVANRRVLGVRSQVTRHSSRIGLPVMGALYLFAFAYLLFAIPSSGDMDAGLLFQSLIATWVPFVLGMLITRKHPSHMIGTLFLTMAYAGAIGAVAASVNHFNATHALHSSPLVDTITRTIGHFTWLPGVYIPLSLMPLYFPNGKLLSPRWRPLVWVLVFFQVWYALAVTLRPWPWPAYGVYDTRSWNGLAGSEPFFDFMNSVFTSAAAPVFPLVILSVILRYRQANMNERTQMKWPLMAFTAVVVAQILYWQIPGLAELDEHYGYPITWSMSMLFPLSIGIAMLRQKLWDIDVVINRALVYGGLTALVAVTYLLLVVGLGSLFQSRVNTISGLVATGVVALLFQPVRDRLQRAVDRLLYGERNDAAAVLTNLARQMEMVSTPAAILPDLVQTIAQTLKVPYVAIWLPDEVGRLEPAAVFGQAPANVQTIPLTYQQENLGRLVVAPRDRQKQFDNNEWALLSTIATLTAPTVRALALSAEVRRSRRHIVTAREDERRRLRRDLHDDLGPRLASQTLGLEAVSQLMQVDPHRAQLLLDSLKAQAEEATLDVRRVVYDLRPPALDDLGLLGALAQIAARYEITGLRFELDLPSVRPDLPAAVETAVYRIAQEAITNVVRHAGASLCAVWLLVEDGHAILEVRDNGCGLRPGYRSGVGMHAMRERVAELDGELLVALVPDGGTLVRTRLPLMVNDE